MVKPDYKNGLINLSATLADFIGDKNSIAKIDWLQQKLANAPKKVVFIIFDGLGVYNVNALTTDNDYYKQHIQSVISSTMPPTTANATTTLASCKTTDEHLWISWSLWLKEYQKVVELFLGTDYYTREKVGKYNMPYQWFIDRANTSRKISIIAPSYVVFPDKEKAIIASDVDELFIKLNECMQDDCEQFIYCYCDRPDGSMHSNGIVNPETKAIFENIQKNLEDFVSRNKDVLIITSADHGHVDAKKYIHINEDKDIMSLQARPISMEARFASFKLKRGCKKKFEILFNKRYGKYFELKSSSSLLRQKTFGNGSNNTLMKEYLGDYIAIGNESCYGLNFFANKVGLFKSLHAGGTKEEMEVPIAIFESKK